MLKVMNVLSVLIIVCSILALLTVVLAKPGEAPNFFGYSLFRVMTGSMEPSIPTDSLIVVKRVPASALEVGDVITFYSRDPSLLGEPNTHRIIRFEEDGEKRLIYTKGDANNIEDRYSTHEEDLIGKVVFSSLGLGKFVRIISNPIVFIPLIIIPLILMLGRSLFDSVKAAKQLAKEEEEAAIREALAELREKRKAQAEAEGKTVTEEVAKATTEEKTTEKTEIQNESKENKTEDISEVTNTVCASHGFSTDIVNGPNSTRWHGRYGVQYRTEKRRSLSGRRSKR